MTLTVDPDFQTPIALCRWWVRYLEIPQTDMVLEPTPGFGNLYDVLDCEFSLFVETPEDDIYQHQPKHMYDWIIANPPFSPMEKGYDILDLCFQWIKPTGMISFLLPWLPLLNSDKRVKKYGPHIAEIIHLPRNIFPGSKVQTAIFIFDPEPVLSKPSIQFYILLRNKKQSLKEFL